MSLVNIPPDILDGLRAARIKANPNAEYMCVLTLFTPDGHSMGSVFTAGSRQGIAKALEASSQHVAEHLEALELSSARREESL